MGDYYNRYQKFTDNSQVSSKIPFIEIPKSTSDLYIVFNRKTMRMDMLSYKYYGDPQYGWLLMQANPSYGGFEFSIPDGAIFRIPYPIDSAINRYESSINKWQVENTI